MNFDPDIVGPTLTAVPGDIYLYSRFSSMATERVRLVSAAMVADRRRSCCGLLDLLAASRTAH